ncbi:hypothetical protein IJG14_01890 [bacterium]|nr:hypothetical protein [bacterium]
MSFNLQPIHQPLIQNTTRMQNDGSGGNLGYMQQKKKKKDEEQDKDLQSNLIEEDVSDILQLDFDDGTKKSKTKENKSGKNWLSAITDKIQSKILPQETNPFKKVTANSISQ